MGAFNAALDAVFGAGVASPSATIALTKPARQIAPTTSAAIHTARELVDRDAFARLAIASMAWSRPFASLRAPILCW